MRVHFLHCLFLLVKSALGRIPGCHRMQDSSSDQQLLSSLVEELDSEARSENDLCARIRTLLEQLDHVRSEQGFSTTTLTARIECAHSNSAVNDWTKFV